MSGQAALRCRPCGARLSSWSARCPACGGYTNSPVPAPVIAAAASSSADAGPASPPEQQELRRQREIAEGTDGATRDATAGPAAERAAEDWAVPVPLDEVSFDEVSRLVTGIEPLDQVLGGGAAVASFILIGGDPGIGKSTLLAQALSALPVARVLYATGEETVGQVAARARRVNSADAKILVVQESNLDRVIFLCAESGASVLVVDSIQTLTVPGVSSAPGAAHTVKAASTRLMSFAKAAGVTVFAVCHVNKSGDLAGPKALEHFVDVVLQFEEHEYLADMRVLRCIGKNRYGPTSEVGLFKMTPTGLEPVDPTDLPSPGGEDDQDDSMRPIAQELAYMVVELGGTIDAGLRDRIAGRLDLVPRGRSGSLVPPPAVSVRVVEST